MPISAPKIPEGLPELMRGLAKSVIKENPENLYVHAAEYFENLIRERDGHLEQGYQTFNAYQVYADYKEKTREKLGLTKDPSLSDGIGGDGDESGSGGSDSNIRGRKRRRARKPSSREKENPPTIVGNPSVSDEGEPQKLKSVSEDSGPVPVVEQEIVKVHYNPPEAVPSPVRVVSAQSVEADQAVSSILDDEQILDSDGTGGRETGDELVDNRDDIGTAPSTAEIAEQSRVEDVDAEPGTRMSLQDMETCFMHANVDDLLEKRISEDTGTVADEGEDIPEGPQAKVELNDDIGEADHQLPEVEKEVKESEETQSQTEASVEQLLEADSKTSSSLKMPAESVVDAVADVTNKPEAMDQSEAEPAKETEQIIVDSVNEQAEEKSMKNSADEPTLESEVINDEILQVSSDEPKEEPDTLSEEKDTTDTKVDREREMIENPIESSEATNLNESKKIDDLCEAQKLTESTDNVVETVNETENLSAEKPEESPIISSRIGFEEDEVGNDANETVATENVETNDDPEEQELAKSEEANVSDQPNEVQMSEESVKDENNVLVTTQNESDQIIDNDNQVENDKPSEEPVPPESTGAITDETAVELKEGSKEAQDEIPKQESDAADVNVDEDPKESVAEGNINKSQKQTETNENTIIPEPSSEDATKDETNKENLVKLVEPNESVSAAIAEEPVPLTPDTKPDETFSDPADAPDVDADAVEEKETSEPNKGETDDLNEGGKNENFNLQSIDQEVNEQNTETDKNALLIKDQSLEDVVHAEAESSGSVVDAVVTSGDLITEENALTIPAGTIVDEVNTIPEPAELVAANDQQGDGSVKEYKIQNQESDEVKVDAKGATEDEKSPKAAVPESLATDASSTFENVVIDEMQKLLQDDVNDKESVENNAGSSDTRPEEDKHVAENVVGTESSNVDEKDAGTTVPSASAEEQNDDTARISPSEVSVDSSSDKPANDESSSTNQPASDAMIEAKDDTSVPEPELPSASIDEQPRNEREKSLEAVVEEPCVRREISPSKSVRLEKDDSTEKQVEELEKIKKVDLSQLSKDSAEALFYTLKKSELENQEPNDDGVVGMEEKATVATEPQEHTTEDDDQDVVVKEEPPPAPIEERTKRSFTDDFLDETPITEAPTKAMMPGDGVDQLADQERSSLEADEQKDEFNPMVMVSMRSKQFQDQLHSRGAGQKIDDELGTDSTPKRPIMRRCMTEMSGLERYDAPLEDDLVDSRQDDPSYVEEEDQFDGYYIGHIKNKILASSVSVADSDCPDGTRSSVESVGENNVRTALETIASTDTESTIASQATTRQAGPRSYLRKHSQNTSSNIPYASFGNAAIDQSLDEFIEREEQHKQDEAMAEAATKIQRSYRTHKKRLLRDYHSTMRTFTEDQSAESGEEYAANVIQIKLDQRRAEADPSAVGDAGEESDTAVTTPGKVGLTATGKRPMYSLNIDEYDTVARRMTLTRGVAMQRNSTPDEDSGKSTNASTDRKPSLSSPVAVKDPTPAASGSGESPSSDEKPAERDTAGSSSDEREQKDALSSSRSKPKSGPASTVPSREQRTEPLVPRTATSRTSFAPLDVQSLLLIARQRTMPVQIDSSVIRVLPKHMRKRISSAGVMNSNGKRK
ncbi:titin [Anopheles maculipalpis]|uniref:titin n=1 Tax=Anopheles maculipalpis TaxID=1496333 RepID=UPI002158CE1C|nr:titin [Anopheles maculipalpis]